MTAQLLTCKRDGFPMVDIEGQQQCVAEYLDRCLGGQRVSDVILRDDVLFYVFENGHELPLLCYCCGKPLVCEDLPGELRFVRGRRFKSMTWNVEHLDDGSDAIDFRLEFSSKTENNIQIVQTSTLSAQKNAPPFHLPLQAASLNSCHIYPRYCCSSIEKAAQAKMRLDMLSAGLPTCA